MGEIKDVHKQLIGILNDIVEETSTTLHVFLGRKGITYVPKVLKRLQQNLRVRVFRNLPTKLLLYTLILNLVGPRFSYPSQGEVPAVMAALKRRAEMDVSFRLKMGELREQVASFVLTRIQLRLPIAISCRRLNRYHSSR